MFREICSLIDSGGGVIGPSGAAVQSVTARWLSASGRTVAQRPALMTLGQWLTRQFLSSNRQDLLLSEGQAALVWEQAAANALSGSAVLNPELAGRLARRAWVLALEHDLEPALAEGPSTETAWLHALGQGVEARLSQEGWVDPATLVSRLCVEPAPIQPAAWFGFDHFSPALLRLVQAPQSIDGPGNDGPGRLARCRTSDPRSELHEALDWVASAARSGREGFWAIVIPDLAARWNEVERIGQRYPEIASEIRAQRPLWMDEPLRLAQTLLGVATGDGQLLPLFEALQSPLCFGGVSTGEARAQLEQRLRERSVSRLSPSEWPSDLPPSLERWRRLLVEPVPERQSPAAWAARFREVLDVAEWPGQRGGDRCAAAVTALARSLEDLAGAALVLGPITAREALARIRSSLRRLSAGRPSGRLQLAAGVNELGPGLSGIWVTGVNTGVFPPRPRPVALLPMRLQREYGLPTGDSVDGHRLLDRLAQYADEVVLSWVERRHDAPMAPSPLVKELVDLEQERAARAGPQSSGSGLERLSERIPPLTGSQKSRSARLLTLQAKCPARAFFEGRLGLRPLERLNPGVSPKERGILAHSVLEQIYRAIQARDGVLPVDLSGAEQIISESIASLWPPRQSTPRGAALAIERELLAQRIRTLLAEESLRPRFRLKETEAKLDFRVGDLELRLRLDRIDEHPDGKLSVIDYKTGAVHRSEFLTEPIVELQLPLYALGLAASGEKLAGALLLQLGEEGVRYEGVWETNLFPKRSPGNLQDLLEQWSRAADALANEFVAGAGWLRPGYPELSAGDWAPLIRPGAE